MAAPRFITELTAVTSLSSAAAVHILQGGVDLRTTPAAFITEAESFTQSGSGATARSVQAKLRDWVSVKDFGATGDGVADDTAEIQAALDAAGTDTNSTVYFPRGTYVVTSKLSISGTRISLVGDGKWASTIDNDVIGNPSDPCFEVTATHDYVLFEGLRIIGNNTTGAGGNGHAIAAIGASSDYVSYVTVRDCEIQTHKGNGKDNSGASMLAAGIYVYGGLVIKVEETDFVSDQYGIVFDGSSTIPSNKLVVTSCLFDTVLVQGIRAARVENLVVDGMNIFNTVGSGGADDAGIWVSIGATVNIIGNRFKNINGTHVFCNESNRCTVINILGNWFNSYYAAAVVDVGTNAEAVNIKENDILWDSTVTSGVGILVSNPSGFIGLSCDIAGNRMTLGGAATVDSAIDINNATNALRGLRIRNNVIGLQGTPSDAQVITTGINLRGAGGITAPLVESNVLAMAAPGTLTTGITIASTVTGAVLVNNVINGAGTDVSDSGTATTQLNSSGIWKFGSGVVWKRVTPTYAGTTAINAALGNLFVITGTNNSAITVGNPSNAQTGQYIRIRVRNTSGGALGVWTFDTLYKLGAAWTQPATGFSRSIDFEYDGTNWVEANRAAADVAN